MKRTAEFGGGKIKAILWTLILVALIYVALKSVPVLVDNFELEDTMRTEARFAVVNRKETEEIREAIWKKIQALEIKATPPIKRDDIRIEYSGRSVNITLRYTVVLDLYFYRYDMNFAPTAGDRAL